MIALPVAFLDRLRVLERSYVRATDPVRQSGFGGGHKRWRTERELILDAVTDDGDLLDVGCANGYLLECLVQWGHERHLRLTPYGVDCGAHLIALAQQRLPRYTAHFWVANAWAWRPPRQFRYVYSLVVFQICTFTIICVILVPSRKGGHDGTHPCALPPLSKRCHH